MMRARSIGAALAMAVMLSAGATATSMGVEGPFYKTEGTRLGATETRLILVIAKETFRLEATAVGLTISCTGLSLPVSGHMQIQGPATGNPGKGSGVADFTGCTQTGNGEPCEMENGLVQSVPILELLGYAGALRGGPVLVLFEPEAGRVLTTLKYVGSGCKISSQAVTGTVVALARVGGAQVQVGGGTETLHGEVTFHNRGKSIFIEKEGIIGLEIKGKMELASVTAVLQGTALLLAALVLSTAKADPIEWGVFS